MFDAGSIASNMGSLNLTFSLRLDVTGFVQPQPRATTIALPSLHTREVETPRPTGVGRRNAIVRRAYKSGAGRGGRSPLFQPDFGGEVQWVTWILQSMLRMD
jgi:hypothetical protein